MAFQITDQFYTNIAQLDDLRYDFTSLRKRWKFYLDSYTGGDAYKDGGYLEKHEHNEDGTAYGRRQRLTFFDNYCKDQIDDIVYNVFSKRPVINLPDNISELIRYKDWQNRIVSAEQFWKSILLYELVFGEMYFYIDHPLVTTNSSESKILISDKDRKDNELYFYFCPLFPFFVRNVKFNINGEIDQILIELQRSYRLITNSTMDIWLKSKDDPDFQINYAGQVGHNYGKVPALRYAIDMNQDGVGDSLIADTADLNRILYNLDSIPPYDLLSNANNKWQIPWSSEQQSFYTLLGLFEPTTGKLKVDEVKYIPSNEKGSDIKQILKDLSYHEQIDNRRRIIAEIMDRKLNRRLSTIANKSGVALAYLTKDANMRYELFANIAEYNAKEGYAMFANVIGNPIPVEELDINFNKRFDIMDQTQHLNDLVTVLNNVDFDEIQRETQIQVVNTVLKRGMTDDKYNILIETIEKADLKGMRKEQELEGMLALKEGQTPIDKETDNVTKI